MTQINLSIKEQLWVKFEFSFIFCFVLNILKTQYRLFFHACTTLLSDVHALEKYELFFTSVLRSPS